MSRCVRYWLPRVALHFRQAGTRLSSSDVPPLSVSMRWSASLAALMPHQWHGGLSDSMSLRLRWYVADACSVDRRLAGMRLTRCACANAAHTRLVVGWLVMVCHVGCAFVVSVCLVYVNWCVCCETV